MGCGQEEERRRPSGDGAGKEGQQVSQRLDSESRLWDNAHKSNVSWILSLLVSTLKLVFSGWFLFKQLGKVVCNFHFNGVCHRMVFSSWNSVVLPLPHCFILKTDALSRIVVMRGGI